MFKYQVLKAFTHPGTGAVMAVGDLFDDAGSLGQKLCRESYAKDVTPHVNTEEETLEDQEVRIVALESEQHSPSSSSSSSSSSSPSSSSSSSSSSSPSASAS